MCDNVPDMIWAKDRPEVLAAYPHRVLEPSDDQFGLGVLSKYPIASAEKVPAADVLATLKLRLVLDVQGQKLALTAVHPMPPISAPYAQERDASLRLEARLLADSGLPGILLGDMNDSPWSTGLQATVALAKGRTRYLCTRNAAEAQGEGVQEGMFGDDVQLYDRPLAPIEMDVAEKLTKAFIEGRWNGDLDNAPEAVTPGLTPLADQLGEGG